MSCPNNPPPPPGFRVWRKPVPAPLTQWAMDLRDHIAKFAYGTTWSSNYGGEQVVARKDFHTWTNVKQPDGTFKLVTGLCLPGITLYEPLPAAASGVPATPDPGLSVPDPNAAVFSADDSIQHTNYTLVAVTATAIVATCAAFAYAIRAAGRARSKR